MRFRCGVGMLCGVLLGAAPSAAQSTGAVLVKGGVNIERAEDNVSGQSGAIGADLILRLSERWQLDAEFWLPAYFTTPSGIRHRDVLFTIGARRLFGDRPIAPFIGFGLGVARIQEERQDAFGDGRQTGGTYYISTGVDIPAGARFIVIPEVRLAFGAGVAIVRPAVGFGIRF